MEEIIPLESVNLSGKTLAIRVDFNCPVNRNGFTGLLDTKRIDDHVRKTIAPLMRSSRRPRAIILLAHQGRKGHEDAIPLRLHWKRVTQLLRDEGVSASVEYIWTDRADAQIETLGTAAVASEQVLERVQQLKDNSVLLLENVRFDEAEETFSSDYVADYLGTPLIKMLSKVPDLVVALDGFSVAHRAQPSVVGLAALGPLYAGPVALDEIRALSKALVKPEHPMLLVVGGAKVDDSLFAIERFLSNGKASKVLTGGIVGLVFLVAQGHEFNEPTTQNIKRAAKDLRKATDRARCILDEHVGKILFPVDVAFGPTKPIPGDDRGTYEIARLATGNHENPTKEVGDIGVRTLGHYISEVAKARTIVMNGTMGRYELNCFELGTKMLMEYTTCLAHDTGAHVLIGGGDTGAALGRVQARYTRDVHVSSSGKAFLQVLSTGDIDSLPAIRVLARG